MKLKPIALIIAAAMLLALLSTACSKPAGGQQSELTAAPGENGGTEAPATDEPIENTNEPTDAPETTAAPEPGDDPTPAPVSAVPVIIQPQVYSGSCSRDMQNGNKVFSAYQYVLIEDEAAAEYPMLASVLRANSMMIMDEAGMRLEELAVEGCSIDPDELIYPTYTSTAYIRRSDSVAFSVLYGGHSDLPEDVKEYFFAYNFETATGSRLALSDVVNDPSAIPAVINAIMSPRNEDGFTLDPSADYSAYFSDPNCRDYAWTLDYNGISLFFNEGAFGIEDAWTCSLFIPFSQYPDFVKAEYMAAPEEYAVAFPPYITCYFELNGNVTPVIVAGVDNDDDGYDQPTDIYIGCGEKNYTEQIELDGFSPVLIHKTNGDFLCVQCENYNDYKYLCIVDITNGYLREKGDFPFRWFNTYFEADDAYFEKLTPAADPNNCLLTEWTEVLSTANASKTFAFGSDGIPVSEDVFYLVNHPWTMRLLQPLEVELTDLSGADLGKLQLSAGDSFEYYATDGGSIAVLLLPDGRLAKIKVVKTEYYESFVNGIPIEELFTDLFFAG